MRKLLCLFQMGNSWAYGGCCLVTQSRLTLWWPHGLKHSRLLCPWNSPGKNTGVGCHDLLQGIFPTQGSNPYLPHCGWILYHWVTSDAQHNSNLCLCLHTAFVSVCISVFSFRVPYTIRFRAHLNLGCSYSQILAWITSSKTVIPDKGIFEGSGWTYLLRDSFSTHYRCFTYKDSKIKNNHAYVKEKFADITLGFPVLILPPARPKDSSQISLEKLSP